MALRRMVEQRGERTESLHQTLKAQQEYFQQLRKHQKEQGKGKGEEPLQVLTTDDYFVCLLTFVTGVHMSNLFHEVESALEDLERRLVVCGGNWAGRVRRAGCGNNPTRSG